MDSIGTAAPAVSDAPPASGPGSLPPAPGHPAPDLPPLPPAAPRARARGRPPGLRTCRTAPRCWVRVPAFPSTSRSSCLPSLS